jgi:hypothetical protein
MKDILGRILKPRTQPSSASSSTSGSSRSNPSQSQTGAPNQQENNQNN